MSKAQTAKSYEDEFSIKSKKTMSPDKENSFNLKNRMRRLRRSEGLRDLVRETHLSVNDLIYPLFVEENIKEPVPISSLPGVLRHTEKTIGKKVKEASSHGLNSFMLFGVSHNKDSEGSDSLNETGLLYRMIDRVKQDNPDSCIIADICFCEYTDHGHCGPLDMDGDVDNDRTLENLARQAQIAAGAGADVIAPSGMMDGMVSAIRSGLDEGGFTHIPIMAYSAKFASSYYGPFRDAAGCSLGAYKRAKKDRKTYQMDPANALEALRETALDIEEGADMVMVKPGLPYLDILYQIKQRFEMPTFAYNVSGEYAMLKFAAEAGVLDYESAAMEMLLSFKRAGADGILTYVAEDAAMWLQK
jgi:porphobilinogen synthase